MDLKKTTLGIEMGSTRIKAVLIGPDHAIIAGGDHTWENRLENGYWTYSFEDVWGGIRNAYKNLADNYRAACGEELDTFGAIGISAMMHGYLPFNKEGEQLAPFRTWRNTTTGEAASQLTELFGFNIPQRWSIAHLYQAILNGEEHVKDIDFLTTLAGYVHWQLTGEKVLGIGDASGMFPIDSAAKAYDAGMMSRFNGLLQAHGYEYKLEDILPKILPAGEIAGRLTKEGAKLLDPSGKLSAGIPLCPPEGDAGTGMAATDSVALRTGNVSAGTSIFSMVVLEKPLSKVYPELDLVTTPSGDAVAMVHCNTCTSDLDAWVRLLGEMAEASGAEPDRNTLYNLFYQKAMEGDADCGGLVNYNYYSGEPVTGLEGGCPLFVRRPDAKLTLANFARTQLYSAIATLKIGMDLLKEENVKMDSLLGHGGLFKVPVVGQSFLAGALGVPVTVMETAGEGGAWGMALLAAYALNKEGFETLEDYLKNKVFAGVPVRTEAPSRENAAGFEIFIENYKKGLAAEKAAVEAFR